MKKVSLLSCIGFSALLPSLSAAQIRNPIADSVFNGFNRAYLTKSGTQTYYANSLTDRSRAYFWEHAYLITAAEDVYDGNPTAAHKQLIKDVLTSFLAKEKTDWKWDVWNDDIEWVVNIFIRGYQITGDSAFLAPALNNWKMTWTRGWSPKYGGGIWEKMDDTISGGKGGLSNWPFVFEGVELYKVTGDTGILNKCIKDYAWARTHAYDSRIGRIYEQTGPNGMNGDDNSYNSGLLVNAAASLFEVTKDSLYYNDALTASAHYIGRIGAAGIMTEDHPANGYFGGEQFARGLSKFTRLNYLWNKYYAFLSANGAAAWKNRRIDYNLTWNNFARATSTDNLRALEAQGSVVIQATTPVLQNLTPDSLAPVTLQAEDFNYMKGIAIDSSNAGAGGKTAGAIAATNFLEYIVKVPTAGVYSITYRVSGTSAGSIQFQLNGRSLITTVLVATGSPQTFADVSTKVTLPAGIQSIRLVGQSGGPALDWFKVTFGDHVGPIAIRAADAPGSDLMRTFFDPSAAKLTIDVGTRQIKDLLVSDIFGRVIRHNAGKARGIWSMDASALPNGNYLLSLRTDKDELLTQRFVK